MECNIYSTLIIITTEIIVIDSAEYTWDISNYNAMVQISLRVISCNNNKFCKYQSVEKLTTTHGFLCSPKGEAFSRRFVRLSVCLVPCPANNFKTTVGILNETWYIYRWQWGEGQNPRTIIIPKSKKTIIKHTGISTFKKIWYFVKLKKNIHFATF